MSLFSELKRRHVWRVAIAYAVVAWLLLQLAAIVLPTFGAPHWVLKVLIGVFVLFFPIAIIVAWAFEVTPEGVRRTESADSEAARPPRTHRRVGRTLNVITLVVLAAAVGVLAWQLNAKSHPGAVIAAAPATSVAAPPAASAIPAKSIAVLPFTNESGDTDQQYFSDGLSEDLIDALSQFAGLKVIGRNSAFQFRNTRDDAQTIGEKLGVAHLLEGSVSRQGDEVRISAELINTKDASTLWSQHYDRPYKDLFALQDTITQAVATALKAKLLTAAGAVAQSDRPPSGKLAAYEAYLKGNAQPLTQAGDHRAIVLYGEAARIDPGYARSYAALSIRWGDLGLVYADTGGELRQAINKARSAVDTALRLDPDLVAGHYARALILIGADLDWQGARDEANTMVALAPDALTSIDLKAQVLRVMGQARQAETLDRKAIALDPLNAKRYRNLAFDLRGQGRLDEAVAAWHKAIELEPGRAPLRARLTLAELSRGDRTAAEAAAKAIPPGFWHDFAHAAVLQTGSDHVAADAALKGIIHTSADTGAYQIAELYALRKDANGMFQWLDRAWSNRDAGIQRLLTDPILLRYKNDPRFAAFCKKVGLPTTTTAKAMP